MKMRISRYIAHCRREIDGASLSLFRVFLGLFLLQDTHYFFKQPELFGDKKYFFPFPGLEWWPHLGASGNLFVFIALAACGIAIMLGLVTPLACWIASLGVFHLLANDHSFFLNHVTLLATILFACGFLNLNNKFTFWKSKKPVYQFELMWLRGLFFFAYFFGGVGKIRVEWLNGNIFLSNMLTSQDIGYMARWFIQPVPLLIGAWSGLLLDLFAPVFLSFARTRIAMMVLLGAFHVLNHHMLNIGLFSYLMLYAFILYPPPSWPSKIRLPAFRFASNITTELRAGKSVSIALLLIALQLLLKASPSKSISCEIGLLNPDTRQRLTLSKHLSLAQYEKIKKNPSLLRVYAKQEVCEKNPGVPVIAECDNGRTQLDRDVCGGSSDE